MCFSYPFFFVTISWCASFTKETSTTIDGADNYEEDFLSSASGSANEQSPSKGPDKMENSLKPQTKKEDKTQSARTEDLISEEIEEADEILSSTSCVSKPTLN